MAATYFPGKIPVSSAMMGLTALFGMGRGEHHRQYHHKEVKSIKNYKLRIKNFLQFSLPNEQFIVNK